jgi:hypothetical protein
MNKSGRSPRALGVTRQLDRVSRRVRPGAHDHRQAAGRRLDDRLDHALVLGVAEAGVLARGAARDDPVGALRDVELDELAELRLVHLPVPERSDQRDERTLERLAHGTVSPATRSS